MYTLVSADIVDVDLIFSNYFSTYLQKEYGYIAIAKSDMLEYGYQTVYVRENNMTAANFLARTKKSTKFAVAIVLSLSLALWGAAAVYGVDSSLNQTINAGTLTTSILDGSRVAVGSPSVTMSAKNFSFDCQYGGSASTGTFGTTSERLYVTNPDAADNGWTLGIAATGGITTSWSGSGANYDFNDPTGTNPGCTDGVDTDSYAGQLSINPSVSTITTDCASCSSTSITKGSSSAFDEGSTDSINLLTAAAGSDDIWRGYLTGIAMSQTIPAETPAAAFSLDLTVTVTAS